MLVNGTGINSQNFRKLIDRMELGDPVAAPLYNVLPQQLLNNDGALFKIIAAISGEHGMQAIQEELTAHLVRSLLGSGLTLAGTWESSNTPTPGRWGNDDAENALFVGVNRFLMHGRMVETEFEITLSPPPAMGGRVDFVYMTATLAKVDPKTGEGLSDVVVNISDARAYPNGHLGSAPVSFSSVFPGISQHHLGPAVAGDIVRFQWQWDVVVVDETPDGMADGAFASFTQIEPNLWQDGDDFVMPLFYVERSEEDPSVEEQDVTPLWVPIALATGIRDGSAVQRAGDTMTGDLGMGLNGIVFGDKIRMVYDESEEALDFELL